MDAELLVTAMAALSRAATEDFSAEEMLFSLCEAAAEARDVDGAGVMIRADGRNVFVHATTEQIQPVEQLQEVLQKGPCADALTRLEPVVIDDLRTGAPWPEFQGLSADQDLGSILAMPLISRGRPWGVLDLYRRLPGAWNQAELHAAQVLADVAVSYLVMAHDRDEARTAQTVLAHRATHDALTGLPNRALLFDRLDHALAAIKRRQGGVAVIFLDLDLFKGVNDAYGHAAADAVLVEVADRLFATLREGDTLARFAGDEFVLVCEGLPHETPETLELRAQALTARLRSVLAAPFRIAGQDLNVTASMGIAVATEATTSRELISEADTAMYAAKQSGRDSVQVRDRPVTAAIEYAGRLEHRLAGALERGELAVFYQPILRCGTREVAAVEALLRWNQPQDGVLPAAAFIDIAVTSGLIVDIGHWVVTETCRQMGTWQRELTNRAPAVAFVNLSPRELVDPELPGILATALETNGLRPGQLGLEIVEENLADPQAVNRLHVFHGLGHPLSIDDFGTGYSSLSRLIDLPAQTVKIDKSFVAGLPDDKRRQQLVAGVLLVARQLETEVVAEGVENAAQEAHLTTAGCQLLQGYHIATPQSASDLTTQWSPTT